ncbi:MAG: AAA family ATPase, partial [Gemmatimonadota bacterium]
MQIICVSRGSLTRGKELAEHLGGKLGYPVLSREKLIEEAILAGVQVSKLETSMVKPQLFTERLARERDHYLAFCTAYLGERALDGPLIYHGRTGHLLLRGIEHVLRVRVVADEEDRIAATMRDLGLDHEKARRYLSAVEEDRRNWARSMYGVSGEETAAYDVVVNVERMSVQNAAASLLGMCQLPEFQETPASRRALQDLALSSRARLQLARDPRTNRYSFTVSAHHGALTVTYLPHDTEAASHIGPVLEAVDGVTDVAVTMASTTILWVQESFDPGSPAFRDVVQIAQKWNAAVELVQHVVTDEPGAVEFSSLAEPVG